MQFVSEFWIQNDIAYLVLQLALLALKVGFHAFKPCKQSFDLAAGIENLILGLAYPVHDCPIGEEIIEEIVCEKIGVTLAGHPVPDECCVEGCKKIEEIANSFTERDLSILYFSYHSSG